ncbi:MAG TPA: dihydrodipicolinate synthase family protein [Actinocrinis sp.]|nr:dihydrodipicolinate synthase family protein [Actinocrinis sp.]
MTLTPKTETQSLRGVLVPLVTPFDTDGTVAVAALEALAHDVLDAGATGIVALGTTAEAATLDAAEKQAVIDVCAEVCGSRAATLIVGAGSNDTEASALALAELAQWPQVGGALVSVPYYNRPGESGVLAHFTRLAAQSPVPLIIYHIPYRTAQPLSGTALRELGRLPNVAGVKLATGGIGAEAVDLLGDCPDGFSVLAGDDLYLSPMLALGATGGILASAHLATRQFVRLEQAWAGGDVSTARTLGHALAWLSAAAFAEPNPVVIKGALHALSRIPTPDVRLPLLPASPDVVKILLNRLSELDGWAALKEC